MNLGEKIAGAQHMIRSVLPQYKSPVIMSSFGKDSMVMLDLLMKEGHSFPVLFHREPFFPEKLTFANEVILMKKLTVYDYAPSQTTLIKANGVMEIVNWYSVGKKFSYLPTGVKEPKLGEEFLCGLRDLYNKPTSPSFTFPWDLVFVGHKSSDTDPIFGEVPLTVDLKQNEGGPDYAFPLRHFTDEDIYQYHLEFRLPFNTGRYLMREGKFVEREDISRNNDYYPVCTRCMDKDGPSSVICPLIHMEISNIGKELRYTEVERPEYLK